MSGGDVIMMITEQKLFNLNKILRGFRVGTIVSFKHLKPFQMLYKREVIHILPEGNEYKDHRHTWNLDVSPSLGSSQRVSSESPMKLQSVFGLKIKSRFPHYFYKV